MKIAIDVGHADGTGASGNGLEEHNVAARAAYLLKSALAGCGIRADIIDFPERSNGADLSASIHRINADNYAAVVSLHCDCADSPAARGAHVICKSAAGCALALEIAERLCPVMAGRAKQVVQRHDLAILNQTRPPAVLVEMGFISNPDDAAMLRDNLLQITAPIAQGIAQWACAHH